MENYKNTNQTEHINLISTEYKEVSGEIQNYTKLQIQLNSIMIALFGISIALSKQEDITLFVFLQISCLLFLFILIQLDQNIFANSAYLIQLERRVNELYKRQLLGWQGAIGYIDITKAKRVNSFNYYIGPINLSLIIILAYTIMVYKGYHFYAAAGMKFAWVYVCISIIVFLFYYVFLLIMRNRFVDSVIEKTKIIFNDDKVCNENTIT